MAVLMPLLRQRFTNPDGPLPGGKLYSYIAGTSTPTAVYTDRSGSIPHTNPVILDANGEAEIWLRPGTYKFVVTDADDVEQYTIDDVSPSDGGGGGIIDSDYQYDGFSARFNEQFLSTGLNDTLEKILNITYTPPQVSLSASGSGTVREKGTAVTSSTLTAAVTKRSDPIAEVRFYLDDVLIHTESSPNPAGGNVIYNWTGSFDDTSVFKVEVDDTGATGGPSTVQATSTFTFVYPYYVGADEPGISAADVAALTKRNIVSTADRTETIVAANGDVFYFAYPASYGPLTSILDANNFETFPDWTLRTEDITGLDGNPVSYRIYEFNNPVVAGSYLYRFRR